MVHEHVPRRLYEHPIVEYIPLHVKDLATGHLAVPAHPALVALDNEDARRQALAGYGQDIPSLHSLLATLPPVEISARPQLPFLAVGFTVKAGIYRGRKVSLATASTGPVYQLFSLPSRHFYKPFIDFVAYTPQGSKLAEVLGVRAGARAPV